ncbi:hypothetical protein [Dehalococcoides mccartyi]|uniref:hypothetical protein n=1 Tax=Dehalococcoides mccartyi TaxID=61435 RepID=UPI000805959F|nr:hypothetical protein [Dehalococcoides mccartyi]OBW62031.1 MAG: hypothetical protein A9181_03435 [Dehalococcoides mccartyi]
MGTTIKITDEIQALYKTAIGKEGNFEKQMICFKEGIAYAGNGYILSAVYASYLGTEPICILARDIKALKISSKARNVVLDIDTEQGIATPNNGQAGIKIHKVEYPDISHLFNERTTRLRIVFDPVFMLQTLEAICPKSARGGFNRCVMSLNNATSEIMLEHFQNDPEPTAVGFVMPIYFPHLSTLDRTPKLPLRLKEVLTIDEMSELETGPYTFITSPDAHADDGLAWAKAMTAHYPEAVIYTQCDNGEDECIYIRGLHTVNSTGVYAIVWNKHFKKVQTH